MLVGQERCVTWLSNRLSYRDEVNEPDRLRDFVSCLVSTSACQWLKVTARSPLNGSRNHDSTFSCCTAERAYKNVLQTSYFIKNS
jgi:hypothetical protein